MLSTTGWGTATGGAALTGVGYALGYGEAAALGATCLLAVAAALLWTLPGPRLSAERRGVPRKVSRGEPVEGVVLLTNAGRRARQGLRVTDRCGDREITVAVPPLRAGAVHELRYPLPTARRGRVPVGPLRLERVDPLGLVRRTHAHGTTDTLLVRPRIRPLPVLPSGRAHDREAPASDTADDGSLTFHALREYVSGDDLRRVHWRSTARAGKLIVRQVADVALPPAAIVLDTRECAYAGEDDFELAVDCAASLAYAAARSRLPVHLVGAAGTILRTEGSGPDGEALLDRLALVARSDLTSVARASDALAHPHGGWALIMVTGTRATQALGALGRVLRRFDRVTVLRAGAGTAATPGVSGSGIRQLRITSLDELPAAWHRAAVR
jgi:uncharacterized protein (DUF58 family)